MKKGNQGKGGGPKPGYKQSKEHKENIKKAQLGKSNSNYKHGKRIDYRKIIGAKPGDGYIIHHIDGVRTHNQKSNLQRLKGKGPGAKTSSTHERLTYRGAGRKPKK